MVATLERVLVDWDAIRDHLNALNRLAADDLAAIWNVARRLPPLDAREYMLSALELILETYGAHAADISAAWWDSMMLDDSMLARPVTAFEQDVLKNKASWGTHAILEKDATAYLRMANVVQQAIFGAQRNTVRVNALEHKIGYGRMARPDACAFCRVLASRGAVYGSKAAALYVGTATVRKHYVDGKDRGYRLKSGRVRGIRQAGEKYHDHCRCVVAPKTDNINMNEPDYVERFQEEYNAAVESLQKDNPGQVIDLKRLTTRMRLLGYGT